LHPATFNITMKAYIRDMQRLMHPARSNRLRGRLARIRKSR
jgi:hypothetical protein